MIETIFLPVTGNPKFKLGIISFGSLADNASVKGLFGRFTLEFALANIRGGSVPQFRVGRRPEENEIIEERNQDRQFCAQGTSEQLKEKQRQADKGEPFEFQRQNKKDVNLDIRIERGESKKKRRVFSWSLFS